MRDSRIITTLIGGLLGLALLWVTFAPETVTRAEMHSYVETTAVEHLRILREDLRGIQSTLTTVGERLAAVEAVVAGRN